MFLDDAATTTRTLSASLGILLFFLLVSSIFLYNIRLLFFRYHGISHRIIGLTHFLWLFIGVVVVVLLLPFPSFMYQHHHLINNNNDNRILYFIYDIILGVLGILTTLSAAKDFPHKYVKNVIGQSGTLSQHAIVTNNEMIEHSFYQGLNLLQAIYLHTITCIMTNDNHEYIIKVLSNYIDNTLVSSTDEVIVGLKIICLWLVTSPWHLRKWFPVHSFSSNWKYNNNSNKKQDIEIILYKIKKWQYIFYKHVILHGINISMILSQYDTNNNISTMIPYSTSWRIFWVALNSSYVMEFLLQTLVKRHVLSQRNMMVLQLLLIVSSSIASIDAVLLGIVRWDVAMLSVFLNFVNRGFDVLNTLGIAILFLVIN